MVVGRFGVMALGLGLALLQGGCLVSVEHVQDPAAAFAKARAEAASVAGRPGPARHLNVLAFDPDEGELVHVSVPMWLARKAAHEGRFEVTNEDDAEGKAARAVARRVRLEDLERAGLGVLAEVEDDDGEQVLIWLR
jgi:hypothetical protein